VKNIYKNFFVSGDIHDNQIAKDSTNESRIIRITLFFCYIREYLWHCFNGYK